jgi:hypothetical protein
LLNPKSMTLILALSLLFLNMIFSNFTIVVELYCDNEKGYHKIMYAVDSLVLTVLMNNAMVMHIFDGQQQLANNSSSLFFRIRIYGSLLYKSPPSHNLRMI